MTVYELANQATPGPWKTTEPEESFPGKTEVHIQQASESKTASGDSFHKHIATSVRAGRSHVADLTLAAHCRNNFMLALRALVAEHDWRKGYAGPCPASANCPTCRIIAELEEV